MPNKYFHLTSGVLSDFSQRELMEILSISQGGKILIKKTKLQVNHGIDALVVLPTLNGTLAHESLKAGMAVKPFKNNRVREKKINLYFRNIKGLSFCYE